MIGKWKESERRREMQSRINELGLKVGKGSPVKSIHPLPRAAPHLVSDLAHIYHQGRAGMEDSLQKYQMENAVVVYARQLDKGVMACLFLAELLGRNISYS